MVRLPEINECQNGKCSIAINCNRCEIANKPTLKWTTDLPTQEGWYWLKEENEPLIVVTVRFECGELVYYEAMSEIDCCVALAEGEWYGPIEPPEYP